ncbi:Adenylate cyclase / Guanylate cyclase [hydrothermal vent metagenome]|uniref:Adenylate cyclase / Guanylate cyclase n=1 Tax=hydrothermal vent metagenome TaxID=652676 RepID=A0A3B0WZT6_9ZZZZ
MNCSSPELLKNFHSDTYQLLEKIGEGGFGEVYKAIQSTTNQTVAIKFLMLNAVFDEDKKKRYIDRFERETLLVSRLQHPNIVRLLDKGRNDSDLLYAVFEYVDGLTLKELLSESGGLSAIETAEIMSQVLDALSHAHEQGVIHRDLKPANIMLSQVGTKTHAKILDFGIGSLTKEARQFEFKTITLTQETLGTPSYSAPEQLRGEPPTLKTDLYVWGLVFLECLTGKPAIYGSSLASIFHKQLSPSNVPLPAAVAGHPVAGLLRRVLNKKTNERLGDARDIYRELGQINFSTLVGSLQSQPTLHYEKRSLSITDNTFDLNKTAINNNALIYTGLTEKKQITVLAVSIAIKSVVDGIKDIEISDTLHRDQINQCIDIAVRFGAFHAGTLAGTMLFYFGYPLVSDNDSRLCARTTLEISSTINQKNALLKQSQGYEIVVKMGMHTGMVMAYADATPEGDTINIAMDLAYDALPRQVLCSDSSKKLLDGFIEFKAEKIKILGAQQQPIAIHRLTGEYAVEAFGFLRDKYKNNDFIGREMEMLDLLNLINGDNNAAAHVYGEAGIGKSRLIYELKSRAKAFQYIVAQCLPEHRYNALYPILNIVKQKYSLDTLPPDAVITCLKNALSIKESKNESIALSLLCSWLHLPLQDDFKVVALAPEIQKQKIFEILLSLILKKDNDDDKKGSSLFVFEDMHWADPTSIEFIVYLFNHALFLNQKTVFISTSRQELPKSIAESNIKSIYIKGLSIDKTNQFIVNFFDKQKVSQEVIDLVVSRTDGIPLFIEELVNMLHHKKLVHHLNGFVDFVTTDKLNEVPETLLDSLQQKLDALINSKETVQLAATVGREFKYSLLIAASDKSEEKIQTDLNELITNELVYLKRNMDGDSYIFKHALVRDAAYNSISYQFKKESHSRVANAIMNVSQKLIQYDPLELAGHLASAEKYVLATHYGLQSIKYKVTGFSYKEALNTREVVNAWVDLIADENEMISKKLSLYEAILPAVFAVESLSSSNAISWSEEVESYINCATNNKDFCFSKVNAKVDWVKLANLHYSSQREKAKKLCKILLNKYNSKKFNEFHMIILSILGQIYLFEGEFDKSISSFETSLSIYENNEFTKLSFDYGYDFYPITLSFISLSYLHVGQLDQALSALEKAMCFSEKSGNLNSISIVSNFKALFYSMLKCDDAVNEVANYYYDNYFNSKEPVFYTVYMDIMHGVSKGKINRSKKLLLDLFNSGQSFATGWYFHLIAKKMLDENRVDDAIEIIQISLNEITKTNENALLPIIRQTLGMCYFKKDGYLSSRVRDNFVIAIELSNKQKAYYIEYECRNFFLKIDESEEVIHNKNRLKELMVFLNQASENLSSMLVI